MSNLRLEDKKISVLITVYNNEKYIEKCIKSLINQTYKNWEAIIVDDKSTDGTVKIIKKFLFDKRIKLFQLKKKLGRVQAINLAIKKTSGNLLAILDSDDISYKNRFLKQVNFFNQNHKVKIVASWAHQIDYNDKIIGKYIGPQNIYKIKKKLLYFNFIPHSTLMFCKKYAAEIGATPYKYRYAIDYELYLKFLKHTYIYIIPEFLGSVRFLKNSITNKKQNLKIVLQDDLNCLNYVKDNFNLSIIDKIRLIYLRVKISIKFFLKVNCAI